MRFKNIEKIIKFNKNQSEFVSSSNIEMLKSIEAYSELRVLEKNCEQIARGVLIRLNINNATKELTSLLGDCNAKNNLLAVTQWVYACSPQQYTVTRIDIDEFTSQLRNYIEEQLNW